MYQPDSGQEAMDISPMNWCLELRYSCFPTLSKLTFHCFDSILSFLIRLGILVWCHMLKLPLFSEFSEFCWSELWSIIRDNYVRHCVSWEHTLQHLYNSPRHHLVEVSNFYVVAVVVTQLPWNSHRSILILFQGLAVKWCCSSGSWLLFGQCDTHVTSHLDTQFFTHLRPRHTFPSSVYIADDLWTDFIIRFRSELGITIWALLNTSSSWTVSSSCISK